jgi:hypothetical protein
MYVHAFPSQKVMATENTPDARRHFETTRATAHSHVPETRSLTPFLGRRGVMAIAREEVLFSIACTTALQLCTWRLPPPPLPYPD